MNSLNFPLLFLFKVINCIVFSDAFTTRDIDFDWADGIAMTIEESVELPQFYIQKYWTSICTRMYSTGEYPCVEALIKLQRQTGYYIIQTYIPTLLIVCLSWISFWIDASASTARVALGITTVLTMTTQTSSAQESLPKVGGSNLGRVAHRFRNLVCHVPSSKKQGATLMCVNSSGFWLNCLPYKEKRKFQKFTYCSKTVCE